MTTALLDVELAPLGAEARPLEDWLTTFPLLPVLLDPYTNESAWILHTARRILVAYAEAGCRGCWVVTCGPDDARRFLGPYAQEILTFADPDRRVPAALGIDTLPAIAFVLPERSGHRSRPGLEPRGVEGRRGDRLGVHRMAAPSDRRRAGPGRLLGNTSETLTAESKGARVTWQTPPI